MFTGISFNYCLSLTACSRTLASRRHAHRKLRAEKIIISLGRYSILYLKMVFKSLTMTYAPMLYTRTALSAPHLRFGFAAGWPMTALIRKLIRSKALQSICGSQEWDLWHLTSCAPFTLLNDPGMVFSWLRPCWKLLRRFQTCHRSAQPNSMQLVSVHCVLETVTIRVSIGVVTVSAASRKLEDYLGALPFRKTGPRQSQHDWSLVFVFTSSFNGSRFQYEGTAHFLPDLVLYSASLFRVICSSFSAIRSSSPRPHRIAPSLCADRTHRVEQGHGGSPLWMRKILLKVFRTDICISPNLLLS